MPENNRMTTRLKELFERPELFVLAGAMNAMGAKMAEVAGFEAFYMSGGNTSAQLMGWTEGGTSMRDMVDNARRIVNTVDIPVFCDMDTGYGDAITVYDTVKEYIRAGIAGAHLEDQTYPPKSGPRRRCVSIEEMVGKLRAAMDAKMELDPDFVIVARCDFAGVPGSTFEGVMERCLAYKDQSGADVVCPAVQSWEENKEAIRRIPGPVLPLFTHNSQTNPTLEELQEAGAAAAWVSGADHHGRVAGVLGPVARFPGTRNRRHRRLSRSRHAEQVGSRQQRGNPGSPAHPGYGGQVPSVIWPQPQLPR